MAQTPYTCDDCSKPFNPKVDGMGIARKRCDAIGDYICDPVADEIRDYDREINYAYTKFPIVPFFDGADATLRFFRKMKEQSPTQGACIERIGVFAIGEGISLVRKKRAGFILNDDNTEVSDQEANQFIDFVESINPDFDGDSLLSEIWQSHENLKTYGNYFIRVDMVEVAGNRFVFFKVLDCETVRYKLTKPNEPKVLMVSPLWTWDYLSRYTPDYLPLYPRFEKTGRGMKSTVIHVKNNVVNREWYGMPDSFPSLRYQLMESQQGQYATENYANDFIPRTIIEIESDTEDDGNDGFDAAVKATYTNRATEKKRVVIRRRLPDEKEMKVHEVKGNADYQFHVAMSEEAERQVIKSHGFHKVLLGSPTPGRLGQSQEFQQVYRYVNFTTIRAYRLELLSGWQKAMELADNFINGKATVTATMSFNFKDLFEDYLQAMMQENGTNGQL